MVFQAISVEATLGVVGLFLVAGVALTLFLILNQSLRRLGEGAARFAEGDLSRRIDIDSPLPVARVATALNQMANQLEERLKTVARQRNELDAMLGSMIEGVLAVDDDERILSLNPAAASILGVEGAWALGRSLPEVVRNVDLQLFVARVLAQQTPQQERLVLDPPTGELKASGQSARRVLQAQGAVLRSASGRSIGVMVVLHDITQLERLEMVRRDFVGNVSHEIRTPVATITAALDTLLDDTQIDDDKRRQFIGMASRQANRLQAIIDDLLSLARIQQIEGGRLATERTILRQPLEAAVDHGRDRAAARNIRIQIEGDLERVVQVNVTLLEQAIANLLDNAVKYSPVGRLVTVAAAEHHAEIVISVIDEGPGIAGDDLPRLFERFYRTDRARSRELGGTGLGLAIVKHIAQAHGGRVSVDSRVGTGSTFRIHLPRAVQGPAPEGPMPESST